MRHGKEQNGGARRRAPKGRESTKRKRGASQVVTAGHVLDVLDAIAPFRDAAEWDNVGLLGGRREWPASRAMLAIDLTDAVAEEALRLGVNLLVVYHPPIFKGIRAVAPAAESPTTRLADLLAKRVSIVALHTALDNAVGGTNDVLLDPFEPASRRPLEALSSTAEQYKLAVFTPAGDVERLRTALSAAGAGVIGQYRECSFEQSGRGTFMGDATTNPAVGRKQRLERVEENRLEMVVPAARVGDVVRALYRVHSYEEPAFDLYPTATLAGRAAVGPGRVGVLKKPRMGRALVEILRRHVDVSCATVVGDLRRVFESVTAAAGSFGVRGFRDPDSLVITGEFKHHDALDLLKRGITAIAIDHSASERPVLASVARRLRERIPALSVVVSRADRSPYKRL